MAIFVNLSGAFPRHHRHRPVGCPFDRINPLQNHNKSYHKISLNNFFIKMIILTNRVEKSVLQEAYLPR